VETFYSPFFPFLAIRRRRQSKQHALRRTCNRRTILPYNVLLRLKNSVIIVVVKIKFLVRSTSTVLRLFTVPHPPFLRSSIPFPFFFFIPFIFIDHSPLFAGEITLFPKPLNPGRAGTLSRQPFFPLSLC
jgi:hypothetical protein